jgi:hypothetical protein
MYCVFPVGAATGFEMLGLFKEVAGDQIYLSAPLAFNWLLPLLQSRSLDLPA